MNAPLIQYLPNSLRVAAENQNCFLIGVANGRALCNAYGQHSFQHAFLTAVQERLRPFGVSNNDVAVVNDLLLLVGCNNSHLSSADGKESYLEHIKAALCYEPIKCGFTQIQINVFVSPLELSTREATPSPSLRSLANAIAFSNIEPRECETTREDMVAATLFYTEMQSGKISLAFQPVVCTTDGQRILYYEVLLRRSISESSLSSPTSCEPIVQALERLHHTERLDASVLWSVLHMLHQHSDIQLACNISPLSLHDEAWWRPIISALKNAPTLAARLTLEITETTSTFDLQAAVRVLNSLRQLGCTVAIAMGKAGLNSLRLAQECNPKIIKINKNVLHKTRNHGVNSISEYVSKVSHNLSQHLIAVGVETDEDLQVSIEAGANAAQGHIIRPPSLLPPWSDATPFYIQDRFAPPTNTYAAF